MRERSLAAGAGHTTLRGALSKHDKLYSTAFVWINANSNACMTTWPWSRMLSKEAVAECSATAFVQAAVSSTGDSKLLMESYSQGRTSYFKHCSNCKVHWSLHAFISVLAPFWNLATASWLSPWWIQDRSWKVAPFWMMGPLLGRNGPLKLPFGAPEQSL